MLCSEVASAGRKLNYCFAQALSEALSRKVMREARAQQDELEAEDQPEGAIGQVLQLDITYDSCYCCSLWRLQHAHIISDCPVPPVLEMPAVALPSAWSLLPR